MLRSEMNKNYIVSPLNYIGGKARILDQIIPYFPNNIETFVDLFCGGCNVGLNIKAQHYIYNDKCWQLIGLLKTFKKLKTSTIIERINDLIDQYELSKTREHNFAFYEGDCFKGVSKYNKNKYLELRKYFNQLTKHDYQYYITLYCLIIFSFNNQIRFNSKNEFNLPVGKRDFNEVLEKKLKVFCESLKKQSTEFYSKDFRSFDYTLISSSSFIYIDPPYLITTATYNENKGWTPSDESDLLNYIDRLNSRNIKFALSNVIKHKGKENSLLKNWVRERGFNLYTIKMDYSNSNYRAKSAYSTEECLITNYKG